MRCDGRDSTKKLWRFKLHCDPSKNYALYIGFSFRKEIRLKGSSANIK